MNKVIATLATGALLSGLSSVSVADDFYPGYVALSYVQLESDDRFFGGDTVETGDVMVRVGGKINDYFASELRVGATVMPEEQGNQKYRNDYFLSGFLRVQKEYGGFVPYLGLSYTYIKESFDGASATLQDFGYAGGFDLALGERLGLNVEYWTMTGEPFNAEERKGPSVGAFYRF